MSINIHDLKEIFSDYAEMECGTWSEHDVWIKYGHERNEALDISLYREPMENEEYAGTYTLQVFDGDNVIFCKRVAIDE